MAGALSSLLLVGCGGDEAAGEPIPGVRAGVTLPAPEAREEGPLDVEAPLLGDREQQFALRDVLGQVVVVNFWGSWCGPCRAEQPELNDAHEVLADAGVVFVGVDVLEDSEANGLAHEREFSMPYRSVWDPDASYAARFGGIGAAAIPTTLVLDTQGRVAVRLIGETDALEVIAAVEPLLDEVEAAPDG